MENSDKVYEMTVFITLLCRQQRTIIHERTRNELFELWACSGLLSLRLCSPQSRGDIPVVPDWLQAEIEAASVSGHRAKEEGNVCKENFRQARGPLEHEPAEVCLNSEEHAGGVGKSPQEDYTGSTTTWHRDGGGNRDSSHLENLKVLHWEKDPEGLDSAIKYNDF